MVCNVALCELLVFEKKLLFYTNVSAAVLFFMHFLSCIVKPNGTAVATADIEIQQQGKEVT